MVVVPKEGERESIALETHRGMGHYGVQRVLDRLQQKYWWQGMGDTVVRINQSLPCLCQGEGWLQGVGKGVAGTANPRDGVQVGGRFRWPLSHYFVGQQVDTCLHRALQQMGRTHSSPIQVFGQCSEGVLEGVLSRYGAPGEVLTDKGGEFIKEFDALLSKHEITHRLASRDHPQADGLAERMVHTMKMSLRKCLCDGGGLN